MRLLEMLLASSGHRRRSQHLEGPGEHGQLSTEGAEATREKENRPKVPLEAYRNHGLPAYTIS
jgi:hypothetical protein